MPVQVNYYHVQYYCSQTLHALSALPMEAGGQRIRGSLCALGEGGREGEVPTGCQVWSHSSYTPEGGGWDTVPMFSHFPRQSIYIHY